MLYKKAARRIGAEEGVSLRKVRAWFEGQDGDPAAGGSKYNPATVEDAKKIIEALEKRIGERDATIEQLKTSQTTMADQIKAIQAANQKKLEEQGNFAEVKTQLQAQIETLRPSAERAAALEKIIRESNEERIKSVPEQYRAMIPSEYAPEKLQAWLNANEKLLVKQPAPNFDAGAGAGSSPAASPLTPELQAMGKRLGVKDEELQAEIKRREAKQQEK